MSMDFHPFKIERAVSDDGERALFDLDSLVDVVTHVLVFERFNRLTEAFKFETLNVIVERRCHIETTTVHPQGDIVLLGHFPAQDTEVAQVDPGIAVKQIGLQGGVRVHVDTVLGLYMEDNDAVGILVGPHMCTHVVIPGRRVEERNSRTEPSCRIEHYERWSFFRHYLASFRKLHQKGAPEGALCLGGNID